MPGLESSSNNHGILFWIKLALAPPPPQLQFVTFTDINFILAQDKNLNEHFEPPIEFLCCKKVRLIDQ